MILPRVRPSGADVAAHYDELDWLYRELWGEHVHHGLWLSGREQPEAAVRQLVERAAQRAGVREGSVVCDVGCGYGATSRLLADSYGAQVTGITLSRAQHDYARSRVEGACGPTFLLGDWLDNALPTAGFDAVLAIESTEHFADKGRGLAEAHRVLREGGRLVIAAWLAGERPRPWEVRRLLEPICFEGRLPGLASREDYLALLDQAGFRLERFEELTRAVRRTWSICITRLLRGLVRERRYRRFLLDSTQRERVFALTPFRIWLAYRTGALCYGLFTALK